jgi:hypothetical protein
MFLIKLRNIQFSRKSNIPVCQTRQSGFQPMRSAKICSAEPSSAKPDNSISEIGGSEIFRTSNKSTKTMTVNPDDWRTPLIHYLEKSDHIIDRKVWRQALKYVILDNTLHR